MLVVWQSERRSMQVQQVGPGLAIRLHEVQLLAFTNMVGWRRVTILSRCKTTNHITQYECTNDVLQ